MNPNIGRYSRTPAQRRRASKAAKAYWAQRRKSHKLKTRWAKLDPHTRAQQLAQLERARAARKCHKTHEHVIHAKPTTNSRIEALMNSSVVMEAVIDKVSTAIAQRMLEKAGL